MMGALPPEQGHALAFTPADELLDLPFLKPDAVPNSMVAYMIAKRANDLRVQAAAMSWGARGARVNSISPGIIATPLAGIVGTSLSWARIASSNASTADPAGLRTYCGGPSEANAARTVFREIPNVLAIILIGNPSARCSLRISAQSSTDNNSLLLSARKPRVR